MRKWLSESGERMDQSEVPVQFHPISGTEASLAGDKLLKGV